MISKSEFTYAEALHDLTSVALADSHPVPVKADDLNLLEVAIKADVNKKAKNPYRWLRPILSRTLDEYVSDYLTHRTPAPGKYDPSLVEQHLQAAGALLDTCLSQREAIFALEAQAINVGFGYRLAEKVEGDQYALLLVQLAANRSLAKTDEPNDETLERVEIEKRRQLSQQLDMHNAHGNAMNYGERIAFLREIFANNILTVTERLSACHEGLMVNFNFGELDAPPKWQAKAKNVDPLGAMVWWVRGAIDRLAASARHEIVFTVHLGLSRNKLVVADDKQWSVTDSLNGLGDITLPFKLSAEHFPIPRHLKIESIRLLGLGAALTYKNDELDAIKTASKLQFEQVNWPVMSTHNAYREYYKEDRACLSIIAHVGLPSQSVKTDAWQRPTVIMSDVTEWANGTAEESISIKVDDQITNKCPIGEWEIYIPYVPIVHPHRNIVRQALFSEPEFVPGHLDYMYQKPLAFEDVFISLKVAVRTTKLDAM